MLLARGLSARARKRVRLPVHDADHPRVIRARAEAGRADFPSPEVMGGYPRARGSGGAAQCPPARRPGVIRARAERGRNGVIAGRVVRGYPRARGAGFVALDGERSVQGLSARARSGVLVSGGMGAPGGGVIRARVESWW